MLSRASRRTRTSAPSRKFPHNRKKKKKRGNKGNNESKNVRRDRVVRHRRSVGRRDAANEKSEMGQSHRPDKSGVVQHRGGGGKVFRAALGSFSGQTSFDQTEMNNPAIGRTQSPNRRCRARVRGGRAELARNWSKSRANSLPPEEVGEKRGGDITGPGDGWTAAAGNLIRT